MSWLINKANQFIVILLLISSISFAQGISPIDSLEAILDTTIKDVSQLNILNSLSVEYLNTNPNRSFFYATKELQLSNELQDQEKIAESHYNLGIVQSLFGNYDLALEHFKQSLKIRRSLKDDKGVFSCSISIANTYQHIGNYVKSIEYSFKALEKAEKTKDKLSVAIVKSNLANVSALQEKYNEALDYYMESLTIFKELGSKSQISANLSNLGTVYLGLNKFDYALDYYLRSLSIAEKLENRRQISVCFGNIAVVYHNQKKYDKALEYLNSSLKMYRELEDKSSVARSFNNIGAVYLEQKKYILAKEFYEKSLILAKEIGLKELIKVSYQNLAELYSKKEDFEMALDYFKLYVEMKDSIQNNEISSKVATIQSKYNVANKEKKIALLKKEKIEQEAQINKRTNIIYLILVSVTLLFLLLFLFARNLNLKRKIQLEKENQLRAQIKLKERELSSSVTYIANKNSVLLQTKEELEEIIKEETSPILKLTIKEITNNLQKNLNVYDDWQKFKFQFDEIYPDYIGRLLNKFPKISHNDLKLCVYLKMGISNKEIASLQNVSVDGIKSANKRLKLKMGLSSEISLANFLKSF